MNFEKLKNELGLDEKLKVVVIEGGYAGGFIYDNAMIINYAGNGYRIIFDEKHVLVQLLEYAYIDENGITSFDDACDYIGGHHLLILETVPEIIKSQIEYCEWKFGKFTEYEP